MKKFFSIMLTLCMCMALGTALTACNLLGDTSSSNSEHMHTYETEWSKDDTYHWYACEDDSCTEISQKAKHTFESNVCTVCLHEKTVVPSINEVTAEQFESALSFENVTNVTIAYESNDEGSVYGYTYYFDENKIKAVYDDSFEGAVDTVYEVDSQKLYGYWYMEENHEYAYTGWVKASINLDDEIANSTINGIELIRQMLAEINYSDCTYANNVYTITQTVDEVTTSFAFQFENDVLQSVRLSSTEGEVEYYSLFTFSDYGTTTVALPTEYKEFSEITPTPSSNWASYFNFDNVTVNTSYARTWSSPMERNVTDYYTMKVDGTEWSWAGDGYSYETLYFDGTNTYIDGILSEDEYNVYDYIQNIGGVEMFALYESCFVETSAGVYYAEEIAAICPDGLSPLQNITLVIVDGKMQSVTYGYAFSIITAEYTEIYTAVVVHMFSNWGETIVEGISIPSHTCVFEEIVKDEFLKAEATCTTTMVYYKSCDCGKISDETFEYGETIPHVLDQEIINANFLYSEATCQESAKYKKSCVCGISNINSTIYLFSVGEKNPNNHYFSSTYFNDENNHWKKCLNTGCSKKIEIDSHEFVNGYCSCGLAEYQITISYNKNITAISTKNTINASLFEATAKDNRNKTINVLASIKDGYSLTAGTEIVIILKAQSNNVEEIVEIENIKVYGNPTISYNEIEHIGEDEDVCSIIDSFTVTFDGNLNKDGVNVTVPKSQTITQDKGLKYVWATCSKYYLFTGWYTTSACEEIWDFTKPVTSDMTLYAGWVDKGAEAITTIDEFGNKHYNKSYFPSCADIYNGGYTVSATNYYGYTSICFAAVKETTFIIEYEIESEADWIGFDFSFYVNSGGANRLEFTGRTVTCNYLYTKTYKLNAGERLYIYIEENHSSASADFTFTIKSEDCLPMDGGKIASSSLYNGPEAILNAIATDSFGNKLPLTCTLDYGQQVAGQRCRYKIETVDELGNFTYKYVWLNIHEENTFNNWVEQLEPTCTMEGNVGYYYCNSCEKYFDANRTIIEDIKIPANGHTEIINEAVAPTCTETGLTKGSHCGVCKEILVAQEIVEALGHSYTSATTKQPTCTEVGERTYTCYCGDSHAEEIPANGHTEIIDEAVAPTCTETGLTEGSHCDVCKDVLVVQQTVPTTDHTEVIDMAIAPTCTKTGLTEGKHCNVCKDILVEQKIVPATGHDWSNVTYTWADDYTICTALRICVTDEAHIETEMSEVEQSIIQEQACEKAEITTYIATFKNSAFVKQTKNIQTKEALEHNYKTEITVPTCTEAGYTTYTCVCGDSYIADEVEALGHSYDEYYVCTVCGFEYYTEGLKYTRDSTCYRVSDIGTATDANIIIPKNYNNLPVTIISASAFQGCTSITSIKIPNGITSIGNYAFHGCSSLAKITIPESVTEIGNYAFYGCSSLAKITVPKSVTEIGNYAFYGCSSLAKITVPESVTEIGNYAFYGCAKLTSITIPSKVQSIGYDAFSNCSTLTSITIPERATLPSLHPQNNHSYL